MRLLYTVRAKHDLDVAFTWYEEQRRGLGFEFLDCVEALIETILYMPSAGFSYHQFKRALVRRFPFSVFYTIEDDQLIIHAVFDNRQDPDKLP